MKFKDLNEKPSGTLIMKAADYFDLTANSVKRMITDGVRLDWVYKVLTNKKLSVVQKTSYIKSLSVTDVRKRRWIDKLLDHDGGCSD